MKRTDIDTYLSSMVVGVETNVPLISGEKVTVINFDNAATTPPLTAVMEELFQFAPWYSSIHRGKGYKSVLSSRLYEEAREIIRKFVHADEKYDIVIYTKNTTESINMLSYMLHKLSPDQMILTTDMEHLANELPWRDKFRVVYAGIDAYGKLCLLDLENKLKKYQGKIQLVAVTGASNVTGYVNPIHKIACLAHQYGAKILVDGAQLVPHADVDMKPFASQEHIDFLVFSAHKMYAPFGTGVLIGPKEFFARVDAVYQGGGDVDLVTRDFIEWSEPPAKHETGTPNIIGVLALATAIKTISSVGMNCIGEKEQELIRYVIDGLNTIPAVTLYCHENSKEERVSLISFTMEGIYHELLAEILSQEAGIAARSGLFCAHPYVEKLLGLDSTQLKHYHAFHNTPFPGLVRVSFGFYNTLQEIDVLLTLLRKITLNKQYYINKYST